ncbi:MAG: hypothetical protein GF332_02515 [Candidatus Moranbacteria bacterium]|nr:hypothetical protein [Candidatus Moranbacteria bacterium]
MKKRKSNTKDIDQAKKSLKPLIIILQVLFVVVFIGSVVALIWFVRSYKQAAAEIEQLKSPEGRKAVELQEVDRVLEQVKRHLIIPDEKPAMALIEDADNLATKEAFYQGAKNGDRILIFAKAKKAVIYRPDQDKIVNVGPIEIEDKAKNKINTSPTENQTNNNQENEQDQDSGQTQEPEDRQEESQAIPQETKIEVRNGTNYPGSAQTLSQRLQVQEGYNVIDWGDAVRKNYNQNVIIDLTQGKKSKLLNDLRQKLNARVIIELPADEKASRADFLIIIGQEIK